MNDTRAEGKQAMTGVSIRLKKAGRQLLTRCKGLRLTAPDGRRRLTDRIADREMFMKGIDYSYYYEDESPEER